jgi:hypothetical protein
MKQRVPRPPAPPRTSQRRDVPEASTNPRLISFPSIVRREDCAVVLGCGASSDGWSVVQTAQTAQALWDESAATVIAWCALSAYCDGDTPEYRFWFRVFVLLQAGSGAALEDRIAMARQHSFN